SNQSYQITVTKNGYSTDKTYPPGGAGNPNPTKPHATVLLQQLTQTSFSIDALSNLTIKSVTPACAAVPNLSFTLTGSKTIGPGIPKYSASLSTDNGGNYN